MDCGVTAMKEREVTLTLPSFMCKHLYGSLNRPCKEFCFRNLRLDFTVELYDENLTCAMSSKPRFYRSVES